MDFQEMIKMIKPVVNISKVLEPFEAVLVGLYGVLYDGRGFKSEAVEALKAMKRSGRKVVLVSNTSLRVQQVIRLLINNDVPVMIFDAVITAGEILHYKLKVKDDVFKGLGLTYFNIGGSEGLGVFSGLDVKDRSKVLLIGDNLATDIKGANLSGLSAALVTKAVHVNFLGEGYIPDVAKTRELATNFDAYPDFIISNLRW